MQPAALRVPMGAGINTKQDEKAVAPTQVLRAENVVFDKIDALKKRNGYVALEPVIEGSDEELAGAIKLGKRDKELLVFTADRCFSRQTVARQYSDMGPVFSIDAIDRPLVHTGTQQTMPDCATINGVTVAAWEDSLGGVWWSLVDETGHILHVPQQADISGTAPRCVVVGGNLHVYYLVVSNLFVVVIDPWHPSDTPSPIIVTDDVDGVYDSCPTTRTNGESVLLWSEKGTSGLRLAYIDRSGAIAGPLTGSPSAIRINALPRTATTPIAVAYGDNVGSDDTGFVAIAYASTVTSTRAIFFIQGDIDGAFGNPNFQDVGVSFTDPQRIALTLTFPLPGGDFLPVAWSAWEENDAQPSQHTVIMAQTSSTTGTSSTFLMRSVGLVSRAFTVGKRAFAVLVHDTTSFNVYLTFRLDDVQFPTVAGRHVPGQATGLPARKHLTSVNATRFCLPVRERVISATNTSFRETGIRLVTLNFDSLNTHQQVQLGRGLYMGGACPMHYDGRQWTEQGFHVGPELITATPSSGAGSLTSSTTYEYRVWYEWTDAQGEIHQGPTSLGTLVTMGASDTQVTLVLPTLRLTNKPGAMICVARSLAAKTGKTAQLFRVTSLDPATVAGTPNCIVRNNPLVDSITFIDRMIDTTLENQETIYTDGGILSNDPASLGIVFARGKSRLFASDISNGNTVRYSQQLADGFGVEIPPDLSLPTDPFGDDITAMAARDDQIIVWKEHAIQLFAGDGPLANGDTSTGGFSNPQLITSDVGCKNPSSIVLAPNGWMFQSAKGIYTLPGYGNGVEYTGAPVEGFNNQRITRATLLADRTSVVFLTDSGQTLLYDYQRKAWSTWTNHEGLDAVLIDNQYYYLRTDGKHVFQETPGVYSDAGLPITITIATAWLHFQEQLQGFSRFSYLHVLGTWISPHQFGIAYQTDYDPQFGSPVYLDATNDTQSVGWITGDGANEIGVEPIGGTGYGTGAFGQGPFGGRPDDTMMQRLLLNEKGSAIQFVITDAQKDDNFGPSFELTELLITGYVKGSARKPFTPGRSA